MIKKITSRTITVYNAAICSKFQECIFMCKLVTYSSVYSTWVLTPQSTVNEYLLGMYDRPPHTRSVDRSHNSCWSHCGQQWYPVTRHNTVYSQCLYQCSIWLPLVNLFINYYLMYLHMYLDHSPLKMSE